MNPYKNEDLRKFIESIPPEEVAKQMRLQADAVNREYAEFIANLKIGKCYLCGGQMDSFDTKRPCYHWFTYPKGIKKKNFEKYLEYPIGFYSLDSYFRWLANSENPIANINDLKEETSSSSFVETTIKYKNIEWAFSIGHTDKEGHPNSQVGSAPHFHIQMKIDEKIFLRFNDFHIPFSDTDLFNFELIRQAGDKIKFEHGFGQGIGILENNDNLKLIDDSMVVADDPDNAPFHTQTIIQAPPGETISGDLISQAIIESKKTKQPVRKILERMLSDAKITTIINPGDSVPKMTKRSGKK